MSWTATRRLMWNERVLCVRANRLERIGSKVGIGEDQRLAQPLRFPV